MVARSRKNRANKLDDTLWAYRLAFKTPVSTATYRLICGKSYHLPLELEHKDFRAIKFLNFDLKFTSEKRLVQLNDLEEICSNAYESSKMYKERMKSWHHWHIHEREFEEGNLILLFTSRLKSLPTKLYSRWSWPFKMKKVYPYGAIDIGTEAIGTFKVNGS